MFFNSSYSAVALHWTIIALLWGVQGKAPSSGRGFLLNILDGSVLWETVAKASCSGWDWEKS